MTAEKYFGYQIHDTREDVEGHQGPLLDESWVKSPQFPNMAYNVPDDELHDLTQFKGEEGKMTETPEVQDLPGKRVQAKRFIPLKRQQRSRGADRLKRKQYYRRHKTKIKTRSRIRNKSPKVKLRKKKYNKVYHKHRNLFKRRKASVENALFYDDRFDCIGRVLKCGSIIETDLGDFKIDDFLKFAVMEEEDLDILLDHPSVKLAMLWKYDIRGDSDRTQSSEDWGDEGQDMDYHDPDDFESYSRIPKAWV